MKMTLRLIAYLILGLIAYVFYMSGLVIFFMEIVLPSLALTNNQTSVAVGLVMAFSVVSGGIFLSFFFIKPLIYILSLVRKLSAGDGSFSDMKKVVYRRSGKLKLPYYLYREVITSLQALAGSLAQAAEERSRMERAKRDWVSGVSHDLKTPLSYVMGYAGLLLQENKDDPVSEVERHRYAGEIFEKSKYMNALIGDLNLIYRQDMGGVFPLQKEEIDLVELVRELILDVANAPQADSCAFSLDAQEDAILVSGDRKLLYRAFMNVFMNAINHNPKGTEINVCMGMSDKHTQIVVSDNGVGMSEDVRSNLFSRYYRHSARQAQDHIGGLGLVVVKNIIEAHDGSISVESEEGNGSKFAILLPVIESILK